MMVPEVRAYLDEVRAHLRLDPATEREVIRELYSYFEERISVLERGGLSRSEAARAAIDSFGRARVIARRMYEAHSSGSWTEAALASLPHLIIAALFVSHLWRHFLLTPLALGLIVGVTLYAWWRGKPSWLYPWVGYSLLPLLIGGYASQSTLGQAASFMLWGRGSLPSIWALLLIFALFVFSVWVITSTTIKVVRRDWILGSLMLVPLPVVGGWLFNVGRAGGLFQASTQALYQWDVPMALALLVLAVTSATFIRLRQRVLKVGALAALGSVAVAMVGHNLWGDHAFFGLLAASLLLLLLLLSPALVEARIGHGEETAEEWWEEAGLKPSQSNG